MTDTVRYDSLQAAAAEVLSELECSIFTSSEIDLISDKPLRATFAAGLEWIERFIMQPHPDLGRRGAVCPFVQPAHEAKALHFCALDVGEMSFDVFIEIMMRLPSLYNRVAGSLPERPDLLSLCVFPRNLRAELHYKLIDCAHSMLRPFYMSAGLMLGEFHPQSAARGVHSKIIFPLRSDVPMFVIRSITMHDILFIDREPGPIGIRIHELECYLLSVGHLLPRREALRIGERIDELKSQLLVKEDVGAQLASSADSLRIALDTIHG